MHAWLHRRFPDFRRTLGRSSICQPRNASRHSLVRGRLFERLYWHSRSEGALQPVAEISEPNDEV